MTVRHRPEGPTRSAAAPAVLLASAVTLLVLGWPGRARADDPPPRPLDAPRIDAPIRVPPLPPEYLVQEHGSLLLAYHPSARERVRTLPALVEQVRDDLSARLGRRVLETLQLRVAAAPGEMGRLSPAEPPPYATDVAFADASLVVMSLSSPLAVEPTNLEAALRHALAHLALDQAVGPGAGVPLWFHEGFAMFVAGEGATQRAQTLAWASLRGRMRPLADVDAGFYDDAPGSLLAQSEAADFVRFLVEDERARALPTLVEDLSRGTRLAEALPRTYGPDVEASWRRDVARRYSFFPVLVVSGLLWLVVAAVVVARRLRSRRAAAAVPGTRRARLAGRRESSVPAPALLAARERSREGAEVPKIEHGGRWHTLH